MFDFVWATPSKFGSHRQNRMDILKKASKKFDAFFFVNQLNKFQFYTILKTFTFVTENSSTNYEKIYLLTLLLFNFKTTAQDIFLPDSTKKTLKQHPLISA